MKRALLGLALAAILPMSAHAADGSAVSYNYVEAGYINADFDGDDADGFALQGSVGFAQNWYAAGMYRQVDDNGVTLDNTTINLGWHHALSDKADFFVDGGYARYEIDVDDFGNESFDGWNIGAGFRGMLSPTFEGWIKGQYVDVKDMDGEFGISAGAIWHFNETWGLTGSYEHTQVFDEDMDVWGVGIRASF